MTDPVSNDTGLPEGAAPSAEYVAQMTAAVHTDPTLAPAVPLSSTPRPDHVPEKFWDPVKGEARWEDLAKSYSELETKLSKPEPETPAGAEAKPAEAAPNSNKIERPGEPKEGEPTAFETTFAAVEKVWNETGDVGEPEIEAIKALGIPETVIQNYFTGLKAASAAALAETHTAAGGAEAFQSAMTWAADNLSDADLAYYNKNCDDPATRTQAVQWLVGKHAAAAPASEGSLVGAQSAAASGDVFNSPVQMTEAMQDPRYKTDPGYRQLVAEKILRSQRAGTMDASATFHSRSR